MLNLNNKQDDVLEKFRIKAYLLAYATKPIIVDEALLSEAVRKLKKLPHEDKDPADAIVRELISKACRLGLIRLSDLTEKGCELVHENRHRYHHQLDGNCVFSGMTLRHCYPLKSV